MLALVASAADAERIAEELKISVNTPRGTSRTSSGLVDAQLSVVL